MKPADKAGYRSEDWLETELSCRIMGQVLTFTSGGRQ